MEVPSTNRTVRSARPVTWDIEPIGLPSVEAPRDPVVVGPSKLGAGLGLAWSVQAGPTGDFALDVVLGFPGAQGV